ncbi:uncharacterized protein LOC144614647 isoform X2 [Panthera onca]
MMVAGAEGRRAERPSEVTGWGGSGCADTARRRGPARARKAGAHAEPRRRPAALHAGSRTLPTPEAPDQLTEGASTGSNAHSCKRAKQSFKVRCEKQRPHSPFFSRAKHFHLALEPEKPSTQKCQ